MQVVGGVLGHAERGAVGEQEVHLGGCLGARGDLEDDADAVEGLLLAGAGDVPGRRDERDRAGRGGHPQAGAHLAGGSGGQGRAVHVGGTSPHRRAGVDVLGDRVLDEALGGEDRHASGGDVVARDHPAHATEVVDVAVRVDHGGDRAVAAVLPVEADRGGRGLARDQRVDDDDAPVALHDGHVREVQSADLVDATGHLVETVFRHQLGLPPQARVDGVGSGGGEGLAPGVGVPDHPPVRPVDRAGGEGTDETAIGVGEVGGVGERQS